MDMKKIKPKKSWFIPDDLISQITPGMLDYYLAWSIKQMDYINETARSINQRVCAFLGAFMVIITPFINIVIKRESISSFTIALLAVDVIVILAMIILLFPKKILPTGIRPEDHITKEMLKHIKSVPLDNKDDRFKVVYIECYNRDGLIQEKANNGRLRTLRILMLMMALTVIISYSFLAFGLL